MGALGPRIKVSTMEKDIEGEGFTFNLLQELRRREPDRRLRLVVGSDNLEETERWHRFGEVARMAPILEVPRGRAGRVRHGFTLPSVSSTAVRRLLARGEDPGTRVPAPVRAYLQENDLYRRTR